MNRTNADLCILCNMLACAWETYEQQQIQYANENVCVYVNARVFLSVRLFTGKRVGGRGGSKGKHIQLPLCK